MHRKFFWDRWGPRANASEDWFVKSNHRGHFPNFKNPPIATSDLSAIIYKKLLQPFIVKFKIAWACPTNQKRFIDIAINFW
mmetsp:Transcript_68788/g.125485  ORF Transcript_68788/g.125485 Transcript_68788/m.125485 type:complete len:81 (-) Transcript_68788:1485-1727(-)